MSELLRHLFLLLLRAHGSLIPSINDAVSLQVVMTSSKFIEKTICCDTSNKKGDPGTLGLTIVTRIGLGKWLDALCCGKCTEMVDVSARAGVSARPA